MTNNRISSLEHYQGNKSKPLKDAPLNFPKFKEDDFQNYSYESDKYPTSTHTIKLPSNPLVFHDIDGLYEELKIIKGLLLNLKEGENMAQEDISRLEKKIDGVTQHLHAFELRATETLATLNERFNSTNQKIENIDSSLNEIKKSIEKTANDGVIARRFYITISISILAVIATLVGLFFKISSLS